MDYRHGRRERRLAGTFGTTAVSVPRARVEDEVGEWRSQALSRYQRRLQKFGLGRTNEGLAGGQAGARSRQVERSAPAG